jgi:CRP-like cAMP-binding protein
MEYQGIIDSTLFRGFTKPEAARVLDAAKPQAHAFKGGDVLWRQGDKVTGIGVLTEGTLLGRRYLPDGKALVARVYNAPIPFNLEAAVSRRRTTPTSVEAQTAGTYHWLPMRSLFENQDIDERTVRRLHQNILAQIADDAIRFLNRSDILTQRTVRERVLMYFEILRAKQGSEVRTNMTQEALAGYLGVDRSSLSWELNEMRREGLIAYKRNRYMLLYD